MEEGIKSYIIKPHARFEMGRRQITEEQVKNVLLNPEEVLMVSAYRKIYQSVLLFKGEAYLYRVFVDSYTNPPEVVTAYRTSKVKKYRRQANEGDL